VPASQFGINTKKIKDKPINMAARIANTRNGIFILNLHSEMLLLPAFVVKHFPWFESHPTRMPMFAAWALHRHQVRMAAALFAIQYGDNLRHNF